MGGDNAFQLTAAGAFRRGAAVQGDAERIDHPAEQGVATGMLKRGRTDRRPAGGELIALRQENRAQDILFQRKNHGAAAVFKFDNVFHRRGRQSLDPRDAIADGQRSCPAR